MTKEGWPRIPRWQANGKLVKIQSDNGSNDQPLERELFGITPNLNLLNRKTLSTQQPIIVGIMMNMIPFIAIIPINVLRIQLLKYHDNDDHVLHIWQLTKVCVINGEDINDHKLQ